MGGMETKAVALIAFLTFLFQVLVSLVADLILYRQGKRTISQNVWLEPTLGIPVMFPVFGMLVSLAVHLFC